jgi:DNA-directed RNA polymerase specialized sigma24 family protein
VTESRHVESLENAEQSGKCSEKSPEDLIVEYIDRQSHQAYLETLKPLAKKALCTLTPVQRRRYLLYVCEGLTTRRIAEIEDVKHQSVVESLQAADKKIKRAIESN